MSRGGGGAEGEKERERIPVLSMEPNVQSLIS